MSAIQELLKNKVISDSLVDLAKQLTINPNDLIATSYQTVSALVTELVEVTTNNYLEENGFSTAPGTESEEELEADLTNIIDSALNKCKSASPNHSESIKYLTDLKSSVTGIKCETERKGSLCDESSEDEYTERNEVELNKCKTTTTLKEDAVSEISNLGNSESHDTEISKSQTATELKETAFEISNLNNSENHDTEINKSQATTELKETAFEISKLNNSESHDTEINKNQTVAKVSTSDVANSNKDDGPVRRSSRIQVRKSSVNKDGTKKSNQKDSKKNKNMRVVEKEHNDTEAQSEQRPTDVKDEDQDDSDSNNNSDELPKRTSRKVQKKDVSNEKPTNIKGQEQEESDSSNDTKNTDELHKKTSKKVQKEKVESNKKSTNVNDEDVESDSNIDTKELPKRTSRKVQKKEVVGTVVNEKPKRAYNKRKKLSSVELDKSIDQAICDVIKASKTEDPEKSEESKTEILCVDRASLPPNETAISEVPSSIPRSDSDNSECKEKPIEDSNPKPVKLKSRWCRSSELDEMLNTEVNSAPEPTTTMPVDEVVTPATVETGVMEEQENVPVPEKMEVEEQKAEAERPDYIHIDDNIYLFTKKKSKSKKQVRRMVCDCTLTKEEQECGVLGCKEECLNRLLMIECGYRCPLGNACSNKKFEKKQYMKSKIFKAEKKGWGLLAMEDISRDDLIVEFVGEIVNHKEYRHRIKQYAKEKKVHSYFMAFKTDEILDATIKGNTSRFINHSCDPNCETQKWTVNGELRVGVFAKKPIAAGEEFTLDYKFQTYGREVQKCLCGSYNCSGLIGGGKRITLDAYGISKPGSKRKKEERKRDLDDEITLEDEIEKLNTNKGLRNKEETLKLARLMVRADESSTRHQLLDIIIKTEQQACLRLFLDYHGLPLMWSWMTDIVDLDLKAKILQVLARLPISNKSMLLDSKVMSVVEKWVQECSATNKENSTTEEKLHLVPESPADESCSEPPPKKLKNIEFSDSETDSTESHNANENSSENSSVTDSFKIEAASDKVANLDETDLSKNQMEEALTEVKEESVEDPNVHMKTNISSVGAELLNNWKNLKEVFRIPRLEQQKKRKEDEMEADHSVLGRTEKKPDIEVTGNHIQVLVSSFSPKFTDNIKIYQNDNPDVDLKAEDNSNNNLLSVHTTANKRFLKPSSSQETIKRNLKEEFNAETELSPRVPLLQTTPYLNQPPVNFSLPLNPAVAPLLKQPPLQAMFPPPQMVYPPSQVPFVNTAAPPPVMTHPPNSMPPPAQTPLLQTPTNYPPLNTNLPPPNTNIPPLNTNIPPPNTNLPPPNNLLPPNTTMLPPPHTNIPPSMLPSNPPNFQLPPPGGHYIPNQPPTNYPNHFGNPGQPYYYGPPQQQPGPLQAVPSSSTQVSYTENICIQSSTSLQLPTVNPLQSQAPSYQSSNNTHPIQSLTSVPIQSTVPTNQPVTYPTGSVPLQTNAFPAVEQPAVVEESVPVPVKLPKNWRSATDDEGNVYYYHSVTRLTQWDPPSGDQLLEEEEDEEEEDSEDEEEDSESEESEESSDTPTYDEPKISTKHAKRKSKKRKTTKAAADTSVNFPVRPEVAKKIRELFRTKMSSYIVHCLNVYRKPDCKVGRITSNEDFKYLARKLTHYTMQKELKQCKNVEDLDCNDQVMHKAKDFIKKYMSKYGSKYSRKDKFSPET